MASNKELVAAIQKIDADFPDDHGMNNAQLSEHLKELRNTPAGEEDGDAKATDGATYVVAKGKSVTSMKGILGPGAEVKPEYFANKTAFETLLEKGVLRRESA